MPNYIKPTLTVSANTNAATNNKGPLSVALSLSGTDLLSVDKVKSEIVTISEGSPQNIIDGSAFFGGPGAGGTAGGYIYMKNISTASTTNFIYVGYDTGSADDLHNSGAADAKRGFTLKVGEFAWFPFDYNYDINIDSNAASQLLEYWVFDRA